MDKITIAFYPDRFENLKKNAKQKNISINQYVRDLVDIGLRVEEAANKNDREGHKNSVLEKLEEMNKFIKKNITSVCENLYLTRYSVLNLPGKTEEELDRVLEKAKIKSKGYLEGLSDKN